MWGVMGKGVDVSFPLFNLLLSPLPPLSPFALLDGRNHMPPLPYVATLLKRPFHLLRRSNISKWTSWTVLKWAKLQMTPPTQTGGGKVMCIHKRYQGTMNTFTGHLGGHANLGEWFIEIGEHPQSSNKERGREGWRLIENKAMVVHFSKRVWCKVRRKKCEVVGISQNILYCDL